jgi:hypothetical protein
MEQRTKFMVAVDGSPSAEAAFHFAVKHTTKEDQILIVTGARVKFPTLTPGIFA